MTPDLHAATLATDPYCQPTCPPPRAAVCLRMQVDPSNAGDVKFGVERAFADYVLANIVLFLVAINYLG